MNATNPYAPPQASVKDMGEPGGTLVKAERGTRLAASTLDGIIAVLMMIVPMAIGGTWRGSGGPSPVGVLLGLVGLVAWGSATLVLMVKNGQSIAKRLLGIKVVRADGSPASVGRIILLRNGVNTILGIIPFYSLVDALLIFGEPRQCVHDKIADTIVIKA